VECLYEIIRQRYPRAASIVTSNLALDEWHWQMPMMGRLLR